MQQHPMQPHMGSYPAHNVTTEIIQKCFTLFQDERALMMFIISLLWMDYGIHSSQYLDENKQLILAILDNQNLGKMNECAAYQARLQANLMYLAAIADSQPQPPPVHQQVPPAAVMQGGLHYMAHQQAQQQMAQQQALMAARNPLQYTQQSLSSMHHAAQQHQQQQQQAMAAHHGMSAGGNNNLTGMPSGTGLGGNNSLSSGGFPDFSRAGNSGDDLQVSRGLGGEMRGNNKSDGGPGADNIHGTPGGGTGQNTEEPEASYLKASEEEGN